MATLLYFSLSSCPYCRAFAPVWGRTLALLDANRVPVHARELVCDSDRATAAAYGVKQFPTILLKDRAGKWWKYEGERKPQALLNWTRALV